MHARWFTNTTPSNQPGNQIWRGVKHRQVKPGTLLRTGLQTGQLTTAFNQIMPLTASLNHSWQDWWQRPDLQWQLLAVTHDWPYWSRSENQVQTPDTLITVAESTAMALLSLTLGHSQQKTQLRKGLSPLDTMLVHAACQTLSQQLNLPVAGAITQIPKDRLILSTWQLSVDDGHLGPVYIHWPKAYLHQLPQPVAPQPPATLPWFSGVNLRVQPLVGRTHLPVDALAHLEVGDVVVLEDSNSKTLRIETPQGALTFNINDPKVTHLPAMPKGSDSSQSGPAAGPHWDQLMVEVSAEFDPFLLPLKEVRAMSEGLLIELDDLAHNTIHLHSQGTHIASGALVVIGDKFAVRVEQVVGQPLPDHSPSSSANQDVNHQDFDPPGHDDDDASDDLDDAIESEFAKEQDIQEQDTEDDQDEW
jgi:flagellar motor switch/type III secretory pathway protein FliN